MTQSGLTLELAAASSEESQEIGKVLGDLSDLKRMMGYADWLEGQSDPKGSYLRSVIEAWDDGEETEIPIDESISEVWRNTVGITLLNGLRKGGFGGHSPAILKEARPILTFDVEPADEELAIGTTKFGGKPDLPADVPWPEFEGKLHSFICQINLAEIADAQAAAELPKSGCLSFFVFDDPIETGQPAAEGSPGAWFVAYFPDVEQLQRTDPPKEFDEGNQLAPECRVIARETLDLPYVSVYGMDKDYAQNEQGVQRAKRFGFTEDHGDVYEELIESLFAEREERSHLLGWSHPQVVCDDPVEPGMRHLLTVASEEPCEWCWADGHQLYFSLSPEDLTAGRFNRTAIIDG